MSKIICDICATVYPDTADVCPICGYPKENSRAVADDDAPAARTSTGSYTPVKGGRFSNKNVKKRNQKAAPAEEPTRRESRRREPVQDQPRTSKGLIALVILLSIAIVLVTVYIGWRFIKGRDAYDNPAIPTTTAPPAPETSESVPAETGIPCVGLTVSENEVTLSEAGQTLRLEIAATPADTTAPLTLTSSDERVVTVTADGVLTAVGPGTAEVTITCGDVTRVCLIRCDFAEETTAPEETTGPVETTQPTEPEETTKPQQDGLKLSHSDVTLFAEGENFRITIKYNGETVSPASVSWSNEDDSVITVEQNGKVTAVSGGISTITVTYNGETEKCIVRCKIEKDEEDPTEETEETEPDGEESGWQISHSDVTLRVGETFTLRVSNESGETADVSWSVSKSGIVSISGNKVTGEADGRVTISATIDGQTFTCIVRVKE